MVEAIFNDKDILIVTAKDIDNIKKQALASPRKRFRLCMHHSGDDRTQEMVIVFHKDTYMPPHRHPKGKSESYHIIEGSMSVFIFDNDGKVIDKIEMAPHKGRKPFIFRVSDSIWHMPVPTSEWLVYHETYTGPFVKEKDVEFPIWAPKEDEREQVKCFLAEISNKKTAKG